MEFLNAIGAIASIISLAATLLIAVRVSCIQKSLIIQGNQNISAGESISINK